MLCDIISGLLFYFFITVAFQSLARWSLERDQEMGSSVRFGDRGLLFQTSLIGYFSFFLFWSGS